MEQITDQNQATGGGRSVQAPRVAVGEVLASMAGHFASRRPGDLITPLAIQACTAGTVYNLRGRSCRTSGAALSRAVTCALPEADLSATRGEYGARLRSAARQLMGGAA
ncbi:hypothetical protein ACFWC2_14385 [Streptomyces diastaticus]|uniref:hypothetical protein n=1 Tax=Streptomyces diastaticus TaxID=1956 RepID=UPI00366A51A2